MLRLEAVSRSRGSLSAALIGICGAAALASPPPVAPPARSAAPPEPGQTAPAQPSAEADKAAPTYLRVRDVKGQSIALEIATREFTRADGTGPKVGLVGVAHIGDKAFYRALEELLATYDVVLYESVKPPGTGAPGGETHEARAESTIEAMKFVGGLIESHHTARESYPADSAALKTFAAEHDPRLVQWLDTATTDAWGNALRYRRADDALSYSLISLGADGKEGGEGPAADLALIDQPPVDPFALSADDGLQTQLADALGLEFQLDAIDYGKPNWRCSDMSMDEVDRRLRARGLDFGLLGGTLAGSSLPAKLITVFLGVMRLADAFLEGAIADTFKVVMIEMLSDERLLEQSMQQFGEGFGEVIINERNQVALDDLSKIIATEPGVKSVAIFYGAGHMQDLAARMTEQLGYQPASGGGGGSGGGERWLTAIKVDFSKSAVSPQDINRIRMMMKQMLRQQFGRPRDQ